MWWWVQTISWAQVFRWWSFFLLHGRIYVGLAANPLCFGGLFVDLVGRSASSIFSTMNEHFWDPICAGFGQKQRVLRDECPTQIAKRLGCFAESGLQLLSCAAHCWSKSTWSPEFEDIFGWGSIRCFEKWIGSSFNFYSLRFVLANTCWGYQRMASVVNLKMGQRCFVPSFFQKYITTERTTK